MPGPIRLELKRGASFEFFYDMPSTVPDGYFAAEWTMHSQAVDAATKKVIGTLSLTWQNPVTTRTLQVVSHDTASWPRLVWVDVLFVHSSGSKLPVRTVEVATEPQVSRVLP